ncbi:hypothetical protein AVEN_261028-1 [Araneus ventricosus]|uniref:Uncharacterized protein n=1 Tax=Araneus ventricosus TaxID=182803 RepID=A0A4Y2UD73_ARAVE|nr:hypothetical protein AVEN_261028-1 [Araneus ventricosus]
MKGWSAQIPSLDKAHLAVLPSSAVSQSWFSTSQAGVNVDVMPFRDVKILVRKRQLLWHSDKKRDLENPNLYCEQLLELNEAFAILLEPQSDAGSSTQSNFSGNSSKPFDFGNLFRSRPDLYR